MYKCKKGIAPSYLTDIIEQKKINRPGLRSDQEIDNFIIPFSKSKHFDRSFAVQGPINWNALPENIKSLNDVDQFKKHLKLKTHLFSQH
jgi:hypothetical protein